MKRTLLIILVIICAIAALRVLSGEDDWICENGQWVKHGQPAGPPPETECL